MLQFQAADLSDKCKIRIYSVIQQTDSCVLGSGMAVQRALSHFNLLIT